ncbi:MAG: hypothetical protein JKY65_24830, partial [Planctomycetes bacterium]|nr:hypothetical protein [Planctomycetota bacterium]
MTVRTTLLLAALTLAGCHAAPLPEDAPDASRLQIDRVGELPLLGRVAIAEFSVESIDTKSRYPGPGALSFDPGTFVPPIHVLGFGVRLTTFPKGLREELPTTLLKDAVTTLEAAQVAVPTASEVSATP